MSKNFELMQQVGRDFELTSILQPRRPFSKAQEKPRQNGARLELGQAAREEAQKLVQRIFLLQTQKAARAVLFAGIDDGTDSSHICLLAAETLRGSVSGSICVVQTDVCSPSLPGPAVAANHHGLAEALRQNGPIRSFAKPLEIDNVWLLSCGSLNPDSHTLLKSDRMRVRFAELRAEFEYLLVAAPSLSQYAEVIALGRLTDGVVLVLEADSTRKEAALRAMENLRAAQIQVLGASPRFDVRKVVALHRHDME